MGGVLYLGFVCVAFAVAVGVRRFDPAIVRQLSRRTGLGGAAGWLVFLLATLWTFLPVLAGAGTDGDGELWIVGAAVAGLGWYLGTIAVTSVGEHRLLSHATRLAPAQVATGTGDALVATAGVPEVPESSDARTPFTGEPAVHTDWILQRRETMGARTNWRNLATGVTSTPFTLGGSAVAVRPGSGRVFTKHETVTDVEPDEPLPDAAVRTMREDPELPDPDDREKRLRFVEKTVRSDESVTVVGTPRRDEAGDLVVDEAPPDRLLGAPGGVGERESADPVLLSGDVDAAARLLHRRVYWLGAGAVVAVLGGQAVAFSFSSASLRGLGRALTSLLGSLPG